MDKQTRRSFRKKTPAAHILIVLLLSAALLVMLRQSVFATTYVITDGDKVITYTTFATNPAEVLSRAGVNLGRSDTYTTAASDADTASITIRRAQNLTVRYRGENLTVSSTGETVAALLSRLNLDITENDTLSCDPESLTQDGMVISVDQIITREESYAVSVPMDVLRCDAPDLPQGREEILAQGRDGELLRTAEVTYVNGKEVNRRILDEKVTIPAVRQILAVGIGAAGGGEAPLIGDGIITLPTGEKLTYTHTAQVEATAYTHTDAGCTMTTFTGTTVHVGTVAVDPRYIPYGTRMFIVSNDGSYVYGVAEAEDCGGDIKGDRMDLYMPTFAECMEFGRRNCTVYFLG